MGPSKNRTHRADKFRLLADEHRLQIIELLLSGDQSVGDIAANLELPQNLTSHHLSALKSEGIVSACKQGRHVVYHLEAKVKTKSGKKILQLDCCSIELY